MFWAIIKQQKHVICIIRVINITPPAKSELVPQNGRVTYGFFTVPVNYFIKSHFETTSASVVLKIHNRQQMPLIGKLN